MTDNTIKPIESTSLLTGKGLNVRDTDTSLIKTILKPTTKPITELETSVQAIRNGTIQDISSFLYPDDETKIVNFSIKENQPDTCIIEIIHTDEKHNRTEREAIEIQGYETSQLPAEVGKLLIFLFDKVLSQAWSSDNRELKADEITFQLSEITAEGIYSDIKQARAGVHKAYSFLNNISIKGNSRYFDYKSKKWQEIEFDGTPFYNYVRKNGIVHIAINKKMNWLPLLIYFTTMPRLFWKIPGKHAPALFEMIFDRARLTKNITPITKTIHEEKLTGFELYISMKSIYEKLMLPPTEETKEHRNAYVKIKKPIYNAIEAIEKAAKAYYDETGSGSIFLELEEKEGVSIENWLEQSRVHIMIFGDFAEPILNIMGTEAKKREIASKRKQLKG